MVQLRDRNIIKIPKKLDEEASRPLSSAITAQKKLRITSVEYNPKLPPAAFPSLGDTVARNKERVSAPVLLPTDKAAARKISVLNLEEECKYDFAVQPEKQDRDLRGYTRSRFPPETSDVPDIAALEEKEQLQYYQKLVNGNAWETGRAFRADNPTLPSCLGPLLHSRIQDGSPEPAPLQYEPMSFTGQCSEDIHTDMDEEIKSWADLVITGADDGMFAAKWEELSSAIKVTIFDSIMDELAQLNTTDPLYHIIRGLGLDAKQCDELDKLREKMLAVVEEEDKASRDFLAAHFKAMAVGCDSTNVTDKLLAKQQKTLDTQEGPEFSFVSVSDKRIGENFLWGKRLPREYVGCWTTANLGKTSCVQSTRDVQGRTRREAIMSNKVKDHCIASSLQSLLSRYNTRPPGQPGSSQAMATSCNQGHASGYGNSRNDKKQSAISSTFRLNTSLFSGERPRARGRPRKHPLQPSNLSQIHLASNVETGSPIPLPGSIGRPRTLNALTDKRAENLPNASRGTIRSLADPISPAPGGFTENPKISFRSDTQALDSTTETFAATEGNSLSKAYRINHSGSKVILNRSIRDGGSSPTEGFNTGSGSRKRPDSAERFRVQKIRVNDVPTKRKRIPSDKARENMANLELYGQADSTDEQDLQTFSSTKSTHLTKLPPSRLWKKGTRIFADTLAQTGPLSRTLAFGDQSVSASLEPRQSEMPPAKQKLSISPPNRRVDIGKDELGSDRGDFLGNIARYDGLAGGGVEGQVIISQNKAPLNSRRDHAKNADDLEIVERWNPRGVYEEGLFHPISIAKLRRSDEPADKQNLFPGNTLIFSSGHVDGPFTPKPKSLKKFTPRPGGKSWRKGVKGKLIRKDEQAVEWPRTEKIKDGQTGSEQSLGI